MAATINGADSFSIKGEGVEGERKGRERRGGDEEPRWLDARGAGADAQTPGRDSGAAPTRARDREVGRGEAAGGARM